MTGWARSQLHTGATGCSWLHCLVRTRQARETCAIPAESGTTLSMQLRFASAVETSYEHMPSLWRPPHWPAPAAACACGLPRTAAAAAHACRCLPAPVLAFD
eukprot:638872-Pelagomonas_calceolata.AAC.3